MLRIPPIVKLVLCDAHALCKRLNYSSTKLGTCVWQTTSFDDFRQNA